MGRALTRPISGLLGDWTNLQLMIEIKTHKSQGKCREPQQDKGHSREVWGTNFQSSASQPWWEARVTPDAGFSSVAYTKTRCTAQTAETSAGTRV